MNTCSTCIYWSEHTPYDQPERFSVRQCVSDVFFQGFFYAHTEEDLIDKVVFSYDEGGAFYTGPAFGCVHHKGKP